MKKWWVAHFADETLRRILRNMAYIFHANILVALIGLLTVAVMARALGPASLGAVALAEAFVRGVDQIVRLEPWQAIIKFGAPKLDGGRPQEFRRLVRFGTLLDFCGGALAALVAIAGCRVAGSWFGFDNEQIALTQFYAFTLFITISSTPTGLMRLFDRFDVLAKLAVGLALFRLCLSLVAWYFSGGVWAFVGILFVYTAAEQLVPFVLAWRELRLRDHRGVLRTSLTGVFAENPHLLRFIVNTNLSALARLSTQRFDTLIVGALMGSAAAGIYHLARRIGLAAVKVTRPMQQALFPDLARVWGRGDRAKFKSIVLRFNLMISIVAFLGVLTIYPLVDFIVVNMFGSEYISSVALIRVQLFAVAAFLAGNTLGPALLVMGADRSILLLSIMATAAFFGTIVPFVHRFGAEGAVFSQILFSLIVLIGSWYLILVMLTSSSNRKTS